MLLHRRLLLGSLVAGALLAPLSAALAGTPLRGLIDPGSLAGRLGDRNLVVVDIRSGETREKGRALFQAGHIPGSVHADYAHASWRLPRENTSLYLPEPAQFEALAGDLGIAPESDVVIVHEGTDSSSFGAAARVYWSFKAMGHASIAILDGGYKGWTDDKARAIATGDANPVPAIYEARPDAALRARLGDVLKARESGTLLVDSRPESFFSGKEKHKAIPAAGHIPGAVNIPHARAFTADNRLKDKVSLAREFSAAANANGAIAYCNTGHWAATDWFVMSEVLGLPGVKLYDGSMLEYSLEKKGPVEKPAGSGS
ncbi:MAG: rhodanese-like domain-containing protein [Beijerinckiaceae bacterium]|nr:rhodanese-like domain-containing protein [Beijerinckiaceae bacterium]